MSWLVTARQYIPAVIGEEFGGGFFAGYISHTADGNPTHALIVAPRATGATGTSYALSTNRQWKTTQTTTIGTTSVFNGAANTAAIVTAGIDDHPAAKFCTELNIGGFSDWYLPARLELDIAYFNLKPGTTANLITSTAPTNDYSVPKRLINYTTSYPTQTFVSAFNTSSEAFIAGGHWSSTENAAISSFLPSFDDGSQQFATKTDINFRRVRAFRRIAL